MATTNKGIALLIMFLVALGLSVVDVHKRLARVDKNLQAAWTRTDGALQQRFDLVPSFITTLKAYAPQEESLFADAARLHNQWITTQGTDMRVQSAQALEKALPNLILVSGNYPAFKTSDLGAILQDKLNQSRTQCASEYRLYREALRAYNMALHAIPGRWLAWAFGFAPKSDYFQGYGIAH